MRKTKRCKKLKLKHIPDFFDDIEEIRYTYRESFHGETIKEYTYHLMFNDGNPLVIFDGKRPKDHPDFEKQIHDQICKKVLTASTDIWYGILYQLFIAEKIHLWDDTAQLDIDEPDMSCYDNGVEWSLGLKTKEKASECYFNRCGWRTFCGYIEYCSDTENSHAVNTFKSIFKNIISKVEEDGLAWVDDEPAPRMAILYRDGDMIVAPVR